MTISVVANPPKPGTPEWRKIITASKVPAILGISRFQSQFSLWHEMHGDVAPEVKDPDRMQWGHIAEASLAAWWAYKHPGAKLNPRRGGTYEIAYSNDALPFDNVATLDRRGFFPTASPGERFHIVECKTAMTFDDWGRPGEPDSIPADYYSQVMFQMGVSGIHRASAVVLGPYGEPEIHDVVFRQDEFDAIVDRCVQWQASLEMGLAPQLDQSVSTYETVRGLHPDIDRDAVEYIDRDQAVGLLDRIVAVGEAEAAARAAKIEAMELMGTARLLKCGDVKVADRRSKLGGKPYVQFDKKADLSEVAS